MPGRGEGTALIINGVSRTRGIIILATLLVIAAAVFFTPLHHAIDPAQATTYLKSIGDTWWAPLVFIALYSLFNVFLVPGTLLTLTAGAVWGWLAGGVWVLLASTIGSAIPYIIARAAGSGWVDELVRRRAPGLRDRLEREGFTALLLMRLIPLVPYNVLNYAAGLGGIRPRDYIIATFVGTFPGIFIFTTLADGIAAGLVSPRAALLRVLLAGVLLAALAILTRIAARHNRV